MAISKKVKYFLELIKTHESYIDHNHKLLKIYKGALLKYVDEALKNQLDAQSYKIARQRIPPINVLKRIIDKQSKIYDQGVSRSVKAGDTSGTATDRALLSYYQDAMQVNAKMQLANEYFNMFKNCLIQPYLSTAGKEPKPALRVIPSDKFIAYSDDPIECEKPTGFILCLNPYKNDKGKTTKVYMAIEKDEFVFFDEDKKILTSVYAPENPKGKNDLGRIPLVYINRDPDDVMPEQDTDMYAMTVLIPILLTDINFAHMFLAFSMMYTLDLESSGIKFGPNAILEFKSVPGQEKPGSVGTIQGHADIAAGLSLVANQFALWLNTKGIKPGAIGEVNGENFSSGIAKIMDEMDTSEDRNAQIPFFAAAETELFDLILTTLHPKLWEPKISMKGTFSPGAMVIPNFAEQVPLIRRGQVVEEQKAELEAGFTTRKRSLKRLNPQMTDDEIEKLEKEIDAEKETSQPENVNPQNPNEGPDDDDETGANGDRSVKF